MLNLERLSDIAEKRKKLSDIVLKDAFVPFNREKELEEFRKQIEQNEVYNPKFAYRPIPEGSERILMSIVEYMAELKPSTDQENLQGRVELLYWRSGYRLFQDQESSITRNPMLITSSTVYQFGIPQKELVEKAREYLASVQESDAVEDAVESVSSDLMKPIFDEAIERLKYSNWSVKFQGGRNTLITIRPGDKTIFIRSGDKLSIPELRASTVTYLSSLLGRAENGETNTRTIPYLMNAGFPGYMSTEFGLSRYLEEKALGSIRISRKKEDAAYYLASQLALSGSFYDSFNSIKQYVDVDTAIEIVARLKRGFSDTQQSGGYLYSLVYWDGYHAVKEHLEKTPEDLELLYVGKVGLSDLPLIRELDELGLIQKPKIPPLEMVEVVRDLVEGKLQELI